MSCLKCGRDTEEGAAFCETCLRMMRNYPVRPGTPVLLPNRENLAVKRPPKRRIPSPEDQLKDMKLRVRAYRTLWLLTLLAMVAVTLVLWRDAYHPPVRPGQNYTSIVPGATFQPSTIETTLPEAT